MLVLARAIEEETVITVPPSDTPTVIRHRILGINHAQEIVRNGYAAPKRVAIHRSEVYDRIQREGERGYEKRGGATVRPDPYVPGSGG